VTSFKAHKSFNPRPREGATELPSRVRVGSLCFNPRPREGATRTVGAASSRIQVSIHAPAKGRPMRMRAAIAADSFNPRPREGATVVNAVQTHGPVSFNPRPREGATRRQTRRWPFAAVSIHAPAKGRPHQRPPCRPRDVVSIHAPAKGRLEMPRAVGYAKPSFNPRPREGATQDGGGPGRV